MEEILKNIQQKIEKEDRTPSVLYNELKQLGMYMMFTNTLNQDMTERFCSDLIKLYLTLQ